MAAPATSAGGWAATTKPRCAPSSSAPSTYRLPERTCTDDGPPFATTGLRGLSSLSAWWVQLGIVPERIEPGHPEQNGRHERRHRTLKDEVASPPAADTAAQQRAFDRFRQLYNDKRPHEAFGQKPLGAVYCASVRPSPATLRAPDYDDEVLVRKLNHPGHLKRSGAPKVYVAKCLAHQPVGLCPAGDGQWHSYYGPIYLGLLGDRRSPPRVLRKL